MDCERSLKLHVSTTVIFDGVKSSQLVVEKTFSRKKAQVKGAKVLNGHRSVGLVRFLGAHCTFANGRALCRRKGVCSLLTSAPVSKAGPWLSSTNLETRLQFLRVLQNSCSISSERQGL